MTVLPVMVSWGTMNSRGAVAWVVVGSDGRRLGRLYASRSRCEAALFQATEPLLHHERTHGGTSRGVTYGSSA